LELFGDSFIDVVGQHVGYPTKLFKFDEKLYLKPPCNDEQSLNPA
jgi:hypothetical protein